MILTRISPAAGRLAMFSLLAASTLHGQTFLESVSRDWFNAANWSTGTPPTANDDVYILYGNSPVVDSPGATAHDVMIGFVDTGTLTVQAGGTGTSNRIQLDADGRMIVTGTGSAWVAADQISINATSNATHLTVAAGGNVSAGSFSAGSFYSGTAYTGNIVVTGAGSQLTDTATGNNWGLTLGGGDYYTRGQGSGSLTISDGASATSSNAAVGYWGNGSVLVTGTGSSWTVGALDLAYDGGSSGTVTVAQGATVTAASLTFGYAGAFPEVGANYAGVGALSVRDAGSQFTVNDTYLPVGSGSSIAVANDGLFKAGSAGTGEIYLSPGAILSIGTGGTAGAVQASLINNRGALVFDFTDTLSFATRITQSFGDATDIGTLTKRGSGTLTLSGNNAYAGGTIIEGGTIRATTRTSALGTGRITLDGGHLTLANNTALNFGRPTTVAADATITSDRATNPGSGVTHTLGALSIGAQTLTVARGSNVTGGTAGLTFGTTTLTGNAAFAVGSGAQLNLGAVGGNFALTKSGAGTLALTAAGTYTGGTTVNGGLVSFTTNLNRFGTGNITLDGGGLLWGSSTTADVSGRLNALGANGATFNTGSNNVTFATALTGTGGFTKSGSGTLTLNTANSHAGGTTVTGGLISFTNLNRFGTGNITLNGGGLQWGTGTTADVSGRLNALGANGATFNLGSNNVTLAGALTGTGGITKSGSAALTLSGNNTFAGGIFIGAGSLLGSGPNPFGTGPITPSTATSLGAAGNGTLTLANELAGTATSSLAGSGTLILTNAANSFWTMSLNSGGTLVAAANGALGSTAGQINVNSGTLAFSGGIAYTSAKTVTFTGNGAAGRNGAIDNLSGHNTFAGDLSLSGPDGRIGAAAGTSLTLAGTIGQQISGWGVTYAGPGTVIVAGANTYSGGTTIAAGTVSIANPTGSAFGTGGVTVAADGTLTGAGSFSGALQNNGTYAPGNSPALVSLSSFSQGSTGTLLMEIAGLSRGSGYDALDISGSASLAGTLAVSFIDGFSANALSAGTSFNFFDWDSVSGSFDSLLLPDLSGSGFSWNTSALYSSGVLSVSASPIPEPSTYAALAGLGALGLALWRRRSRRGR